MKDQRFRDLCIGYVLSELSDDERDAFLRELHGRGAEGRETLRRAREAYGAVSFRAPGEAPPPELRDRVLERAAAKEAKASDGPGRPEPEGSGGAPPGAGPAGRGWRIAAAAALVGLLALGLYALQQRSSLQELRARLDSSQQRLARMEGLEERMGELREDLLTVASPATRTRDLDATRDAFPGRARVFIDPETGHALLFARELPVLSPDSVYQLWTLEEGTPESAGTFRPDADGRARVEVSRAGQILEADAVAVTMEPAPGSPKPTADPILVAGT